MPEMPYAKLLIHHHDSIYIDAAGKLYLSSGIGVWLDGLSAYFENIGLLFFTSASRTKTQDYQIKATNISCIDLGGRGSYFDYFKKRERIRSICTSLSGQYDYLLIRGMTPSQGIILEYTKTKYGRLFYLVRSPIQSRNLSFSLIELIAFVANRIREKQFRRFVREGLPIVTNSLGMKEMLFSQYGVHSDFATTNVISESTIPELAIRPLGSPVLLLFVGRISEMKGFKELVLAAKKLHEKGISFLINVVGDGNAKEISAFKALISSHQLSERFIFHGRVANGPELFKLYRESDIFVLPTYSEGFPRVYWESAAHSLPVIITPVGGIPAMVKDGQNGIFCAVKDANDLNEKIRMLINDNGLREKVIQGAFSTLRENTLEKGLSDLAAIIYHSSWKKE